MSQTLISSEITGLTGSYFANKYGIMRDLSNVSASIKPPFKSITVIYSSARSYAGPTHYPEDLSILVNLLRETSLLDKDETVIPFSLVSNGRVVPYPNTLMTIFLQIINKDGIALDEYIYVFETSEVARGKCKTF